MRAKNRAANSIIESFESAGFNAPSDHATDSLHHGCVVTGRKREGLTRAQHAARASRAVDVSFRGVGHVIIDHMGHSGDVNAARGDVGSDQDLKFS